MAICDEGDEVLVPEPFYSNYSSFSRFAGAKVVPIATSIETGFHLPDKRKSKLLSLPRREPFFFQPGKSDRYRFHGKEIRMIGELAIEHDLYIIGDEVYRQFVYDEETEFLSIMKLDHLQDRVVIVDSISKHYSACGARIGLIASKIMN